MLCFSKLHSQHGLAVMTFLSGSNVFLSSNWQWKVLVSSWRVKRALSGEVVAKVRCHACRYVVYIYRCICAVRLDCTEDFPAQLKKGKGRLGKQAMEVARLVNDKENCCRFEVQRAEYWIHTRPTWSKAVKERLLDLFCD